jgi:hypothetical protein
MWLEVILAHFKERYFTVDFSPSYPKQLKQARKCQAAVKLPGSFCPCIPRPRLHSHLNFAGYVIKTVIQSFYLSCGSELARQGTSLNMLFLGFLNPRFL